MSQGFRARIRLEGKTATAFSVPPEVIHALGGGKRAAVRVTIGPHTYRSTIATYGEDSFLPLSAANRTAAGVAAGDDVEVTLALDTDPREVAVPVDLASALAAEPGARAAFDRMSFTDRREIVEGLESAKRPETRARRLDRALAAVRVRRAAKE